MAALALVPSEYGYVVLVIVLYCILNFWMGAQVSLARLKYKVFYPTLYATEDDTKDFKLFNCIQRGHQHSLEHLPIYFILTILGGIKHPFASAGLGVMYIVTRYFYFTGYATGVPENRLKIGKFIFLALLGLMMCTISTGVSLVRA